MMHEHVCRCHLWTFYSAKQRMLCRCCYDMEMYELVEKLYTLVQQGHGLTCCRWDGVSMDLNMGIGQILDESKM